MLVKARAARQASAMSGKNDREKRLAAALRENLKRRKTHAGAAALAEHSEHDRDSKEHRDEGEQG